MAGSAISRRVLIFYGRLFRLCMAVMAITVSGAFPYFAVVHSATVESAVYCTQLSHRDGASLRIQFLLS